MAATEEPKVLGKVHRSRDRLVETEAGRTNFLLTNPWSGVQERTAILFVDGVSTSRSERTTVARATTTLTSPSVPLWPPSEVETSFGFLMLPSKPKWSWLDDYSATLSYSYLSYRLLLGITRTTSECLWPFCRVALLICTVTCKDSLKDTILQRRKLRFQ